MDNRLALILKYNSWSLDEVRAAATDLDVRVKKLIYRATRWYRRKKTAVRMLNEARRLDEELRLTQAYIRSQEDMLRRRPPPPGAIPMPTGAEAYRVSREQAEAQVAVYDAGESGRRAVKDLVHREETAAEYERLMAGEKAGPDRWTEKKEG